MKPDQTGRNSPFRRPCLLLLLVFLLAAGCGKGIFEVTLQNKSKDTITGIELICRGDSKRLEELRPGESRLFSLKPGAESSVEIGYAVNGQQFSKDLDVYIGPSFRGTLDVHFGKNGGVTRDSNNYSAYTILLD